MADADTAAVVVYVPVLFYGPEVLVNPALFLEHPCTAQNLGGEGFIELPVIDIIIA